MIILPEQVTKAIDVLEKSGCDAYIGGGCVRAGGRPPLIPFTLVHKAIVPRRVMWYNTLDTL